MKPTSEPTTMKKYLYSIGQQVVIPVHRFPRGHNPTKGDIYTISGRRTEEFDQDDPFNDPGNYYHLKEVPNGSFRESDITHSVEPNPTNNMKPTKTYLVDINLVTSVEIPPNIDPDTDDALPYIREAVSKKIGYESDHGSLTLWMMENIGDIRPDDSKLDPEVEAYYEGRRAWVAFESEKRLHKGNPYDHGTRENMAWNRGFNVG